MNIFTIITTILNLIVCTYAAFKKDNPTYSQQIAHLKDPTIMVLPVSSEPSGYNDVTYDNYKFKTSILHYSILVSLAIIFIVWFIYGWTTLSVSKETLSLLPNVSKLYEPFFFSLLNTAKCTIPSICILSCGLIYKNLKNNHNSYRIFHIVAYSILTISVIGNFIFLLNLYNLRSQDILRIF